MKNSILAGLFLFSWAQLVAQPVRTWQSHPSLVSVNDLAQENNGAVWASTEGGVFRVLDNQVDKVLTTMEGLYLPGPSAMHFSAATGELWFGFSDGMLQTYNLTSGTFTLISDIQRTNQFSRRDINRFLQQGDSLFIATGFGIVAFSVSRKIVLESYLRFGSLNAGVPVFAFSKSGSQWIAATQQGVVETSGNQSPVIPDSWERLPLTGTPAGVSFTEVTRYNNEVFATAGGVTYRFDGSRWNAASDLNFGAVRRFVRLQDSRTVGLGVFGIYLFSPSGITQFPFPEGPARAALQQNNRIILGTPERGLVFRSTDLTTAQGTLIPNGPALNTFSGLSFRNGRLVSGSSVSPGGATGFSNTGYYVLENGMWKNFTPATDTAIQRLGANSIYITQQTDSFIVAGSFGNGLTVHRIHDRRIETFRRSNSPLIGLASSPDFIVITGLTTDPKGWVWASILQAPTNPLVAYNPGKRRWHTVPYASVAGSSVNYTVKLVDSFGQLWIALSGSGSGLLVYQPGNLETTSDDRFALLTENSANLPSGSVSSVVQDKRGEIWIGTSRGVARFPFPELVITGGSAERQAQWLITESGGDRFFFLRDLSVSSMVVNEANQKWIGSNGNGLWQVDASGSRALAHFTRDNSSLISNNVLSLAQDPVSGTLYIATDAGLVSYVDVARTTAKKATALTVYPNPFSYTSTTVPVTIDGLPDEAIITVMASDGMVVRKLETSASRASWDGLDASGRPLNTGVYVIVAKDRKGSERRSGKIIITR